MIIHDCKQGTVEWHRLRLGIPTASRFDKIFTPGGKPTTGAARRRYMNELLAERALGRPAESFTSGAMEHGHEMEPEAVAAYEFQNQVATEVVGFVTTDDGRIGASPDRFVGSDGALEVKCPEVAAIHLEYLRAAIGTEAAKGIAQEYKPQVQGQLWITGRQWSDTTSYFQGLPQATIRISRDDAKEFDKSGAPVPSYMDLLISAVTLFSRDLEREWSELSQRYGLKDKRQAPEEQKVDGSFLGITQADIDALMEAKFPS